MDFSMGQKLLGKYNPITMASLARENPHLGQSPEARLHNPIKMHLV